MHQLLSTKLKIWIVVGIAFLASWSASALGFNSVTIATIVGGTEVVALLLLAHSWRVAVRAPLIPRPKWLKHDLSGSWRGELVSEWRSSPGNDILPPKSVTVDVRQTWQDIVFTVETDSMRGRSKGTLAGFDPITEELTFRYFYETEPRASSVMNNPPQRLGSAIALFRLADPKTLKIRYTNERGLGGEIDLKRPGR